MSYNPKVDAYIAKAADFAKPILEHIRELVHETCPDVEETIKWSMPCFDYMGIMCSFAAFKAHCSFGFWKASIMKSAKELKGPKSETAMGNLGKLKSMEDLPKDSVIKSWIREAMVLNENGITVPKEKPKKGDKADLVIPDYMRKALKKDKNIWTTFDRFSFSHQRDYIEWITEAKTEPTREKRIAQMLEWLAEGKSRHWKYQKEKEK